jgi:hypothetical protein
MTAICIPENVNYRFTVFHSFAMDVNVLTYLWVQLHFVITVIPEGRIHVSKHFFRHPFKHSMTLRVYNYIVMLCYVMLCYVMLCYVMLCYVMLRYVTDCNVLPFSYVDLCNAAPIYDAPYKALYS